MSEDHCEDGTQGQFRFEDGELVLSDTDATFDNQSEVDGTGTSRKGRRKQTFERRNIKKVREDVLSEDAKAAQQAEMDRRRRLFRDSADHTKFSNIEFLLNDGTVETCVSVDPGNDDEAFKQSEMENGDVPIKRPKLDALECPLKQESDDKALCDQYHFGSNPEILHFPVPQGDCSVVTKTDQPYPTITSVSAHPRSTVSSVGSASQSLFGYSWRGGVLTTPGGQSRDDAILLGDSDEETEKTSDAVVIELSDDDADARDDSEYETEICELQDAENLTDEQGRVLINPNRDVDTEPAIYLPSHIARVIKPHQVSGIRFLYDNLIESLQRFESTDGFGCILAHSMGLGKTIQIIGFLDAIFRHCKAKRVLAIVPINTIQNWQAEFEMWLPTKSTVQQSHNHDADETVSKTICSASDTANHEASSDSFADIFADWVTDNQKTEPACEPITTVSESSTADAVATELDGVTTEEQHRIRPFKLFVVRDIVKTMTQRHQIIRQWFDEGGVLLLGYEMFRLLLNQKRINTGIGWTKAQMRASSRGKKGNICVDLEKEEKREKMWADFHAALLDPGPQLVICDEGHRIKNSEASISKALKAIKTRRRVVLTGYPLQNNLMEYWCMVDFVRPNYLGTKQEFTNMFQRPIENGQCIDSTPEDRKVMQGRAHVLHDLLAGFVQRRSHAVLKASLPPKTEIVLLIKLSPLQRALYAAFMRSLSSSGLMGWAQVNTLKTYAMCCKIWNHPDILWRAMEEHKEAMDFDIDDPSSTHPSTYTPRGLRRNSTSSLLRAIRNDSLFSSEQDSQLDGTQTTQADIRGLMNWSMYGTLQNTPFSSNPFYSALPHSFSNPGVLPTSPSTLVFPPSTAPACSTAHASTGTYDWASGSDLWGPDFRPGNIEHSGKIMLFLSLLEECVLVGDKILVFTQSLYTLDLLERILRRLPLPGVQNGHQSSAAVASSDEPSNRDVSVTSSPVPNVAEIDSVVQFPTDLNALPSESDFTIPDSTISSVVEGTLIEETRLAEPCEPKSYELTCDAVPIVIHPSDGTSNGSICFKAQPSSETTKPSETEEQQEVHEETLRSLHYRLASRRPDQPTVWTKNVHYFRLDGSTTASEREKLINHFNDSQNPVKLFLVSTRAGCLGVNLIGANRVVVFDASWNPCHDCQAVCRVYRYGQVKPCYIYRLVSENTMEKRIYDRQVTKQGMSDRVVDELNPCQQFTRSQVELLMSFEDKDMPSLTDEDLQSCSDLTQNDPVLTSVLNKHKPWITKIPFTHESLLIDRKDYRLTRVEKRLAKQRYEQEKRLSLSYQRAHLLQYHQMQALQHQQLLAAGINPALVDHSQLFGRTPNILSRGFAGLSTYRPTYTCGMAALDAMRQVQRESDLATAARRLGTLDAITRSSDCKVTRVVATTDLYFPSTTESTTIQRKIPKGELLEVIQTPKGKYLRIIRTGDLFVVKTNANTSTASSPTSASTILDLASESPKASETDTTVSNTTSSISHSVDMPVNATHCDRSTVIPDSSDLVRNTASFQRGSDPRQTTSPNISVMHESVVHATNTVSSSKVLSVHSAKDDDVSLLQSHPDSSDRGHVLPVNATVDFNPSQHSFVGAAKPVSSVHGDSASITALPSNFSDSSRQKAASCVTQHVQRSSVDPDHRKPYQSSANEFHSSQQSQLSQPTFKDTASSNGTLGLESHYLSQTQARQQLPLTWICQGCGRPPVLGCSCASSRSDSVSTTSQHPHSSSNFSNEGINVSSFTDPHSSNAESLQKTNSDADFLSSRSTNATHFHHTSMADAQHPRGQQQQQQQYLRAAEEVTRQSAAAAAYLNFHKSQPLQITPQANSIHNSEAMQYTSKPAFGAVGQVAAPTRQQLIANSASATASQMSHHSSPHNAASVVHDYFAQLAGQHSQQASLFPSSVPVAVGTTHPMAAAMHHYLASNSGTVNPVDVQSSNCYNNLAIRHTDSAQSVSHPQPSGVQNQRTPMSLSHQRSPMSEHQSQQQTHQFPFIQPNSHVTPFDRFQPHRLLPNFRFP